MSHDIMKEASSLLEEMLGKDRVSAPLRRRMLKVIEKLNGACQEKEIILVTKTKGAYIIPMKVCMSAHRMLSGNTDPAPVVAMVEDVMGYDLQTSREVVECIVNNLARIGDVEVSNSVL